MKRYLAPGLSFVRKWEGGREGGREGEGKGGDGVETGCCKLPGRPTRYTIQQDIASPSVNKSTVYIYFSKAFISVCVFKYPSM